MEPVSYILIGSIVGIAICLSLEACSRVIFLCLLEHIWMQDDTGSQVITMEIFMQLGPYLAFLSLEATVFHSFAAIRIEKLLLMVNFFLLFAMNQQYFLHSILLAVGKLRAYLALVWGVSYPFSTDFHIQ